MYLLLFISMKIGYGYPVPSDKVSFAKFLTPLPGKGSFFFSLNLIGLFFDPMKESDNLSDGGRNIVVNDTFLWIMRILRERGNDYMKELFKDNPHLLGY